MIRYVGLDVHKRVIEACVVDAAGQIVFRHRFDLCRESLAAFATTRLRPTDRVVLEATTTTWAVVEALRPFVAEIVVGNPMQTKAIAQAKVKTDKVDAYVLAQLLRCDFLPRVWQPDAATQELRSWTSRRASLVGDCVAVKNRIHSVLAQRLIMPAHEDLFGKKGRAWLEQVQLDAVGRWLIDSDLRVLAGIEKEIADLESLLAVKGHGDERVKLLMTLPGVSTAVAQTLLSAWGDVGRFRDGDHAAGYLGLAPSTKQSAEHCYHGPITKAGRSHARWMLVQAAQHLRLHPGPLGHFFRKLAKKKNYNVAVVATARKLAVIAWHMLTHNEPYRYAQPATTQVKLARLRIEATGEQRRGGATKGVKPRSRLGPGISTRKIKPLAQVYQEEGLPALTPAAPGERRMAAESGAAQYVADLDKAHIVPRQRSPQSAEPAMGST